MDYVPAGFGKHIQVLGQDETFLRSDESVSVFINDLGPGMGVPVHVHHYMDEMAYVLAGRIKVVVDDDLFLAGPGDFFWTKGGTPHGFAVRGDDPCRLLWVTTPGNYDKVFETIASVPLGPEGPDLAKIAEAVAPLGTELVGPPPL